MTLHAGSTSSTVCLPFSISTQPAAFNLQPSSPQHIAEVIPANGSPHDDCQSTVLSSVFQISAASTASGGVVCGPAVASSLIPTSTSPPVLSISEVTNTLLDQ